jgi:hypothetical protein
MKQSRILLNCARLTLLAWSIVGVLSPLRADEPYSPEHPVVQAMVKKAVDFLSSSFNRSRTTHEYDILMGYTAYKATEEPDHPLVKKAIPFALKTTREIHEKSGALQSEHIIYDVSISAMLLSAVDGVKYKTELEYCRDFLKSVQRDNGGFGYLTIRTGSGDASQTQYVTLALWSMKQANIEIDFDSVEKVAVWLQNAQRSDGGWTYQTPSSGDVPNHQMLAAGLSAALISADILGVMRGPGMKMENALASEDEEDEEIPQVFRRVSAEVLAGKKEKKFVSRVISRDSIQKVATKASSWLSQNEFKRGAGGSDWFYYWLYSQERYESFLEILKGRREKDPVWYKAGVEILKKYQDPATGAFGLVGESVDPGGVETATCLSILFLLRTTQKSIGDLKEATSAGGYGLGNVAEVTSVDGKVVDKSKVTNVDDMLKMLENSKGDSPEDKLLADRIPLETEPKAKKEQLNRFSRMLRSPSYAARALAAKILGRGDDLDYVPDLIYALSDPDPNVPLIAENSLGILSRQMTNAVLPKDRTITADDRVKAERRWQAWYLSVRPDHRFISN